MKGKKIALIGNMNNSNFAIMRYFHELGVKAYLFKYANEFDHFQPECDTYEYEKWAPYIIQTNIINADYKQFITLSRKELHNLFCGYDFYIGNGFTPAYFNKAGLKLDLFLPCSVGIEFTFRREKSNLFDYVKEALVRNSQIKGIKKSVKLLGTADAYTFDKASKLNVSVEKLAIPTIFNREPVVVGYSKKTRDLILELQQYEFIVFSHVSHFPFNHSTFQIKRNDILFQSFARYIHKNPDHNSKLVLLDYGDTRDSKGYINELGIENRVLWLPKMMRKEIMPIIETVHIGAGEFGGYTWGGTGWEFLSKGKLFLQFVNLSNDKLEDLLQMPVPKFINSDDPDYIADMIFYYYTRRNELKILSEEIKAWFDENAGIGLADKYIKLLQRINS